MRGHLVHLNLLRRLSVQALTYAAGAFLTAANEERDQKKWQRKSPSKCTVPLPDRLPNEWSLPNRIIHCILHPVTKACRARSSILLRGHYEDKFGGDGCSVWYTRHCRRVTLDESCNIGTIGALIDVSVCSLHIIYE